MSMDSFDEFSYSVQLDKKVTGNDNTVVEGSLSIIPATEIYYEDNFDAIQYTNGDAGTVPQKMRHPKALKTSTRIQASGRK